MIKRIQQMVSLLFLSVVFISTIMAQGDQQSRKLPLIPFNTNFWNYWDHHWTMWLPEHPIYEMIELSSYDNPHDTSYKLLRVIFTEREGNKKQYFYLNDQEAVNRSRANAYYRDIKYRTEGNYGEPLNLYMEFKDKDDHLIQWSVEFEPDKALEKKKSELTPSIHSVGGILLFLLRDQSVDTPRGKLLIDGTDYSFKGDPKTTKERYRSWYNHNVYSAVIVFGKSRFEYIDGRISNTWGREFQKHKDGSNIFVSNLLGYENEIRFKTDKLGQILTYSNVSLGHTFRFDFNPALPTIASARNGQRIGYSVSFDEFKNLMQGIVQVKRETGTILLEWQPQNPDWAKERIFQSVITFDGKGYNLDVAEKR